MNRPRRIIRQPRNRVNPSYLPREPGYSRRAHWGQAGYVLVIVIRMDQEPKQQQLPYPHPGRSPEAVLLGGYLIPERLGQLAPQRFVLRPAIVGIGLEYVDPARILRHHRRERGYAAASALLGIDHH